MGYTWKWHYFLCCFALWVSALLNAVTGFSLLENYNSNFIIRLLGYIGVATAALAVFVAVLLIIKRWLGVRLLYIMYILSAAIGVLELLFAFDLSRLVFIGVSIAMLFANKTYYEIRSSCFTTGGEAVPFRNMKLALIGGACMAVAGVYVFYNDLTAVVVNGYTSLGVIAVVIGSAFLAAAGVFAFLRNTKVLGILVICGVIFRFIPWLQYMARPYYSSVASFLLVYLLCCLVSGVILGCVALTGRGKIGHAIAVGIPLLFFEVWSYGTQQLSLMVDLAFVMRYILHAGFILLALALCLEPDQREDVQKQI